jgi:hypothetical protein
VLRDEICGHQGPLMELLSARRSIPVRSANVNAISMAPHSVRRRTDGSWRGVQCADIAFVPDEMHARRRLDLARDFFASPKESI